jgi:hypothetical protein
LRSRQSDVDRIVRELANMGVPASQVRELCRIDGGEVLTDKQAMRLNALHRLATLYHEVAENKPLWSRRLAIALDDACALGVAYEPPSCVAVIVADAAKWVRGAAKLRAIKEGKA